MSRICRACMAVKQKMLNINHFKGSFKDLTGIDISPSDGLPQWLCIECSGLLKKFIKFRHLLMKSHNTLSQCVLKTVLMSDRESCIDIEAAPYLPLAKESSSHEQSSGPDPTKSENITQKKDSGNATSRVVKKYGSAKAKIKETKIKTKKITVIRKSDTQNGILSNGEQTEVQNNVVVVLLKNKNNKDTNVKSTIVTDGGVVNN